MNYHTRKWWLIAIGWCLLIAFATRAPFLTGDATEAMLDVSLWNAEIVNYLLRKGAHVTAFGLLALFFWLAMRGKRYSYVLAWCLASLYGAMDEWHQSFLPERTSSISDVFIDSGGALVMLLIVYFVYSRHSDRKR